MVVGAGVRERLQTNPTAVFYAQLCPFGQFTRITQTLTTLNASLSLSLSLYIYMYINIYIYPSIYLCTTQMNPNNAI